ncbi:spore germination protein (amino acid permease) [Paenibacillus sp. UNC496MF]|uniref:GerAB/ArcD/ProY family transporter n=1 Tax=Paenibacillus sp. UNC496MF TaxID=1502753 RepID=UPI0008F323D3|nr:endospore germination permease [Paenibacillus sp. UNC496MF]SFI35091.1 spore germination protein (amino acid permease) [Paenibacillus sp. UNC496MF]
MNGMAYLKPDAKQNRITITQFVLIIHSMQLGVSALSLPSDLARIGGTDGWIALFAGWLGSLAAGLIIVQVMKKHPTGTVVELVSRYFGRWLGRLSMIFFGVYATLYAFLILDRMVLLVQSWIMQQSKTYVLMLLFFIPAYMIVKGGVRVIGRYAEIVVYTSVWMLAILGVLLREGNWLHLLPVLKEGWLPVMNAVPTTILSFLGFEIIFFIYPNLEKKQHASLGVLIANTYTLCVYLFITLVCFLTYSPDEITQFNQPVISIFKILETRYVERFDIIMLTWYLLIISKTWIPSLYMSVYCMKRLFVAGKPGTYIAMLLGGMFLVTWIWNPDWNASSSALKWFSSFGFAIAYLLPVCLWCILSVLLRFKRWST